jgi:hypothetical protein
VALHVFDTFSVWTLRAALQGLIELLWRVIAKCPPKSVHAAECCPSHDSVCLGRDADVTVAMYEAIRNERLSKDSFEGLWRTEDRQTCSKPPED